MHGEIQFTGTLQRLVRHVFRAPGNVLKQTMVSRLHAEQVVAAVEGGPEHRPVAGPRKHLGVSTRSDVGNVGLSELRTTAARWPRSRSRAIAQARQSPKFG